MTIEIISKDEIARGYTGAAKVEPDNRLVTFIVFGKAAEKMARANSGARFNIIGKVDPSFDRKLRIVVAERVRRRPNSN